MRREDDQGENRESSGERTSGSGRRRGHSGGHTPPRPRSPPARIHAGSPRHTITVASRMDTEGRSARRVLDYVPHRPGTLAGRLLPPEARPVRSECPQPVLPKLFLQPVPNVRRALLTRPSFTAARRPPVPFS